MVKYIKYGLIALGVLFIILTIMEVKSCYERTRQDNASLKGLVQGYKEEIETIKKEKEKMEERIAEKDRKIEQYKQDIVDLQHESYELENQIEVESVKLKKYKEAFNLIQTKDEQIENLKLQVESLEKMFSLAQKDIITLKQKAYKWKLAYEEQRDISVALRRQLTLQEQANETADSIIDDQGKKIKKLKRQKTLYQVGWGLYVALDVILEGG